MTVLVSFVVNTVIIKYYQIYLNSLYNYVREPSQITFSLRGG